MRIEHDNSVAGVIVNSTIIQGLDSRQATVPGEWPNAPKLFVDRESERSFLSRLKNEKNVGVAVVSGALGVGKRSLVCQWLNESAKNLFPDGVLYADLSSGDGYAPVVDIMRDKLKYWVDPASVDSRSDGDIPNLYRSVMRGKNALVFLDGVLHAQDIKAFEPPDDGSFVIATSYREDLIGKLPGVCCKECRVSPLSNDDARSLFFKTLLDRDVELLDREDPLLQRVINACGGLPAVVVVAANAYCQNPARETLEGLLDGEVDRGEENPYLRVLRCAHKRLGDKERDALWMASSLGMPRMSLESFAATCGFDQGCALETAQSLERAGFVMIAHNDDAAKKRCDIQISELIVRFMARGSREGRDAAEFEAMVERAISFAVELAVKMDKTLKPKRLRTYSYASGCSSLVSEYIGSMAVFDIFHREREFFSCVVSLLRDRHSSTDESWIIAEALWSFYNSEHLFSAGVDMLDVALLTLEATSDRRLARALMLKGNFLGKLGRIEEAREALKRSAEIVADLEEDDYSMRSSLEEFIGSMESLAGNHELALSHYAKSLALSESRGLNRSVLLQCVHAAHEQRILGNSSESRILFDKALSICSEVDEHTAFLTKLQVAEFLGDEGDWNQALSLGGACLEYFERTQEHYQKMRSLLVVAQADSALYMDDEARACASLALKYFSDNYFEKEASAAREVLSSLEMCPLRRFARRILYALRRWS